jgi:ribonucleoside-diphosphate reductase beta chain
MRLFQQAKRAAAWDPRDLDLAADARDWTRLTASERDLLLRLTALFQAGEEGMTLDIPPLLLAMARDGRVEEQLFLATLLADEAKHTEFFRRVLDDVCGAIDDLHRYHTPSFQALFGEELPRLMAQLIEDSSPAAQAEAMVAYTLIGEGVLSETGHYLYRLALRTRGLFPGLLAGLARVERDESRHMTFGVYHLARLVVEDAAVWPAIERRMNALVARALGIVVEFFEPYAVAPFGLTLEDTVTFAMSRFARRSARVERARDGRRRSVEAAGDPAAEILEWLSEQVAPLAVTRADGDQGAVVLRIEHDQNASVLRVSPELLDLLLPEEIITSLHEGSVPAQLAEEPGVRLNCVERGGGMVVRADPA